MNPHFFTAPFYFAFIWFRVQGFRGGFAAIIYGRCPIKNHSRPFLWKGQTSEARRGWHPRV